MRTSAIPNMNVSRKGNGERAGTASFATTWFAVNLLFEAIKISSTVIVMITYCPLRKRYSMYGSDAVCLTPISLSAGTSVLCQRMDESGSPYIARCRSQTYPSLIGTPGGGLK